MRTFTKTSPGPLSGRVVVVTGAGRGLGAAMALGLSRRGARVALIGRQSGALTEVAASLPGPAGWWEADITDDAAMARAATKVRDTMGPPSAVIANAGVAEGGPFMESDPATWRRVIDVNLTGSAITARSYLPDLVATRGYFLQIASLAAIGASPMMSAYCASKAGVESFAHALQAEVAHQGVAVGIAYLNWTETDMIRDADQHAVLRELRGHMPPPARKVYPVEVVAARMITAVERRSAAVYVPKWLRLAQIGRAVLPPVVTRISRVELPRLSAKARFETTGLLGAGAVGDPVAERARTERP